MEDLGEGLYKWKGFRVTANNSLEGWTILNALWVDQQQRQASATILPQKRKDEQRDLEERDARFRRGVLIILKLPPYTKAYTGHQHFNERAYTFVEDVTWIRATIEVPAKMLLKSRLFDTWLDEQLCKAMRGLHAKAKRIAATLSRSNAVQYVFPQCAGDMDVKGSTSIGKLIYKWEGHMVEVTPIRFRPPVPSESSSWKTERHFETTPMRAVRKMILKVKWVAVKAKRGECQRIVAKGEFILSPDSQAAANLTGADRCPALTSLGNPVVLQYLREAYEYLGSFELLFFVKMVMKSGLYLGDLGPPAE